MVETPSTTTDKAAKAAHATIDRVAARGQIAEQRAREMGTRAAERSRELSTRLTQYVEQHPFAALGMAAAAGFILSSLIRRS